MPDAWLAVGRLPTVENAANVPAATSVAVMNAVGDLRGVTALSAIALMSTALSAQFRMPRPRWRRSGRR